MCVTLLLAGALALRPGVHVCRSSRGGDVSMKILRHQAGASADSMSAALDRLCGAPSGVFVLSYTEAGALSNSLLERVVADFEASELYGGPALACAQIVRDGGGPQDALCDQRGVTAFPTTEVWQKGSLIATVGAFELEATLRGLGLRTARRAPRRGGQRPRDGSNASETCPVGRHVNVEQRGQGLRRKGAALGHRRR